LVEWDEDAQCWVGYVPALNWLSDSATTEDELHERITEAIVGCLEALDKAGQPIPTADPAGPLVPPWERRSAPSSTEIQAPTASISLAFVPA